MHPPLSSRGGAFLISKGAVPSSLPEEYPEEQSPLPLGSLTGLEMVALEVTGETHSAKRPCTAAARGCVFVSAASRCPGSRCLTS